MAFEQELTALITQQKKLIDTYESKKDEIEAAVSAALQSVSDMTKTLHVSATGNNLNDGSAAKPLATISEAVRRAKTSSFLRINLMSDIEISDIDSQQKVIYIVGTGGQRKITAPVYLHNFDNKPRSAGFTALGGRLEVIGVNVDLEITDQHGATASTHPAYRSFIKSLYNDAVTSLVLSLNSGSIVVPDKCSLIGSVYFAPKILKARGMTYDSAAMPGRWVSNVAAGTARADVTHELQTNLATL